MRSLSGICRFDSEAFAQAYLDRHGAIAWLSRGVCMTLRPREAGDEWILVAWHSGRPYALEAGRTLRRMRYEDVK